MSVERASEGGAGAELPGPFIRGLSGEHVIKEPVREHEELAGEGVGGGRMRTACNCLASLGVFMVGLYLQ